MCVSVLRLANTHTSARAARSNQCAVLCFIESTKVSALTTLASAIPSAAIATALRPALRVKLTVPSSALGPMRLATLRAASPTPRASAGDRNAAVNARMPATPYPNK